MSEHYEMDQTTVQRTPESAPEFLASGAAVSQRTRTLLESHTFNHEFQRDKAIFALTISLWDGRRVQSDQEIQELGVRDIVEYKKHRSKGTKELVSRKALTPMTSVKSRLTRQLSAYASQWITSNLYLVGKDFVNDVADIIREANDDLDAAVAYFLQEVYAKEIEETVARFREQTPGITEAEFRREFPSPAIVRTKFGIRFGFLRTPADVRLNQLASEYQISKLHEATRELVDGTADQLRVGLIKVLAGFARTIREGDDEKKINNRTIRAVRNEFAKFKNIAPIFGDNRISALIDECVTKFETAQSWTVEEVRSLGIEGAVEAIISASNDEAEILKRKDDYLNNMYLQEVSPEMLDLDVVRVSAVSRRPILVDTAET